MTAIAITCCECKEPIRGDHLRAEGSGEPIHIRCERRRIERRPGFIAWVKKGK